MEPLALRSNSQQSHPNSLTLLLLIQQLDVLSDQVNDHVFERPRLDIELLLSLANVGADGNCWRRAIVRQQTLFNCLREVLLCVTLYVVPLFRDLR